MKVAKRFLVLLTINFLLFMNNVFATIPQEVEEKTSSSSKSSLTFEQIKMAAESGDSDAQYALGYMSYYGKGGAPKDLALAKKWIGKAADQHQPQAMRALALINKGNKKGATQDPSQVVASSTNQEPSHVDADVTQRRRDKENTSLVNMRTITPQTPARDDFYTIQLLGASSKAAIDKLIEEHHMQTNAKVYRTTLNNKDWFVLIYGEYATKAEAKVAAKKFENELKIQPWVKSYASVKNHLEKRS